MDRLNLPRFNIPDLKPKSVPPAVFHEWVVQNFMLLRQSGRLSRILRQPTRRPVDSRFILR